MAWIMNVSNTPIAVARKSSQPAVYTEKILHIGYFSRLQSGRVLTLFQP